MSLQQARDGVHHTDTILRPQQDKVIMVIPSNFSTGTGTSTQTIDWLVYEPTGPYDRAVIIAYGSDGLAPQWKPEITRHATKLADEGILALIPDYFQMRPAAPHGNSEAVFGQIVQRHDEWSKVLRDAVVTAKGLSGIIARRVGLLGFSLGGFLALRIRDEVNVLVEYFAPTPSKVAELSITYCLFSG